MRIALFGATGGVGGHFLIKLLAKNYEVTALVRKPEKLREHTNLSSHKGDVTNPSDVAKVIVGSEVIVSCLGNVKGVLIMEKATEAILQAAKCLLASGFGPILGLPGRRRPPRKDVTGEDAILPPFATLPVPERAKTTFPRDSGSNFAAPGPGKPALTFEREANSTGMKAKRHWSVR